MYPWGGDVTHSKHFKAKGSNVSRTVVQCICRVRSVSIWANCFIYSTKITLEVTMYRTSSYLKRSNVRVTWIIRNFSCVRSEVRCLFHRFASYVAQMQLMMGRSTISRQKVQGLTHCCWVSHISVSKLTSIASDSGLSHNAALSHYPKQCWNILYGPPSANFGENFI